MFGADLNRTPEQIFDELRRAAQQAGGGVSNLGLAAVQCAMGALLVRLSKDAAETADKNLRLQKQLALATWGALVVAVLTLVVTVGITFK